MVTPGGRGCAVNGAAISVPNKWSRGRRHADPLPTTVLPHRNCHLAFGVWFVVVVCLRHFFAPRGSPVCVPPNTSPPFPSSTFYAQMLCSPPWTPELKSLCTRLGQAGPHGPPFEAPREALAELQKYLTLVAMDASEQREAEPAAKKAKGGPPPPPPPRGSPPVGPSTACGTRSSRAPASTTTCAGSFPAGARLWTTAPTPRATRRLLRLPATCAPWRCTARTLASRQRATSPRPPPLARRLRQRRRRLRQQRRRRLRQRRRRRLRQQRWRRLRLQRRRLRQWW